MARRTASSRGAAGGNTARARRHRHQHSSLGRSLYHRRLRLEPLEDRRLLANVTVTTLADTIDFNDGVTSLREAIFATNTVPGADTIDFAPALFANGPGTIHLTQGELRITDSLTINGPGAELLAIDASGNDPTPGVDDSQGTGVFLIIDGSQTEQQHVRLVGLTLTGGDRSAITTWKSLTVEDLLIVDNFSRHEGGGISAVLFGDATLSVINSTVRDNRARFFGGGIHVTVIDNGIVTIVGSDISSNTSGQDGGGALIDLRAEGTLRIEDSTIEGNDSSFRGGGLYLSGNNIVVANNTISQNTSTRGGGVYLELQGGSATFDNLHAYENSASDGGGIYLPSFSVGVARIIESSISHNFAQSGGGILGRDVEIVDSTFSHNTASAFGGGISVGGTSAIMRSTISSNSAREGGGISSFGLLTVAESTVDHNSAQLSGGGIRVVASGTASASLQLLSSTISGNIAGTHGGGVFHHALAGDSSAISHTTIARNIAGTSAAPGLGGGLYSASGSVDLDHSLLAGNENGAGASSDLVGLVSSQYTLIGLGAEFLGPLADNGGRTKTHVLLAGSPAIDAGDPTAVPGVNGVPPFDQRGEVRVSGERIDVGAVELREVLIVVDTIEDEFDGDMSAGRFSLREAIALSNSTQVVEKIVFADDLAYQTIQLRHGPLAISRSINIAGLGASRLTIDASGNDPTPGTNNQDGTNVFDIVPSVIARDTSGVFSVQISGLTLTGGDSRVVGGAIRSQADLILKEMIIVDNHAESGGGVWQMQGSLVVESSIIENNLAERRGGGIAGNFASISVSASRISGNTGRSAGGGISAYSSDLEVRNSTISGNTSVGFGSAVYLRPDLSVPSTLSIFDSTISGNHAAFYSDFGLFNGGAIAHFEMQPATIAHTNIVDNSGGGFYSATPGNVVHHAIIAGNSGFDFASSQASLSYSLIGNNSASDLAEAPIGLPDANGNLIGGPVHGVIDPLLGPLADNGGFLLPDGSRILTHALLPGSPAIDAGDPNAVAGVDGVPVHDQRGAPFTRVFGGRIDIGAVETIPAGFLPGDYNGDGVVDAGDYTRWRNQLGQTVAAPGLGADGNGDGTVDALDYAVWKANYGSTLAELGGGGGGGGGGLVVDALAGHAAAPTGADFAGAIPGHVGARSEPPSKPGADRPMMRPSHASWTALRDLVLAGWVGQRSERPNAVGDIDLLAPDDSEMDDEVHQAPQTWDEAFAALCTASAPSPLQQCTADFPKP